MVLPSFPSRLGRRAFLRRVAGAGLGLAVGAPLLAGCGTDGDGAGPTTGGEGGSAIVDDVVDFALSSDEWEGAFGFVTLRLHPGRLDGQDVLFIRTDTSEEDFAEREGLVFVPKLRPLAGPGLSHPMYLVEEGVPDQPAVLSTAPGREGYSPAWRLHRVRFEAVPRPLGSVAEIESAREAGDVVVEQTDVVLNAPLVSWPGGQLPVDRRLTDYLDDGPLIEAPDPEALTVTFKLSQCYPNSWYIVTGHSIAPAAEMTHTVFAPGLQGGPSEVGATGRTNVFMNGVPGPGPMGFQPSAFDFAAGDEEWSPYWDHFTYAWREEATPRVLTSQQEVLAARDAGELDEFPGVPDTEGQVFTVNCPVPVLAPNTFEA